MSWTHHRDTTPTARKPHVCCLCELPITTGEKYLRRDGFDEDGRVSVTMHLACEDITAREQWTEDDWAFSDAAEFRERLALYESHEAHEGAQRAD